MAWIALVVAGVFEVAWAIGLKYTEGFTRTWPSVATLAAMFASIVLLAWAMKTLPVGTVILGIVLFGEAATLARLACVALIVVGIVGLRMVTD